MKSWRVFTYLFTWLTWPTACFQGLYWRLKMCSLSLFPPPLPIGQTTVCESNNELLSRSTYEDQGQQVGTNNTCSHTFQVVLVMKEATSAGSEIRRVCTYDSVEHGCAMSILCLKDYRYLKYHYSCDEFFALCAFAGIQCPRPIFPPRVPETPQPDREQQQGGFPGPLGNSVDEERHSMVGCVHAHKGMVDVTRPSLAEQMSM